jgi:hypothetical protein
LKETDSDADGSLNQRATHTYDEDGNWLVYDRDDNMDGIIDLRQTRTYDEDGNWLAHEFDSWADEHIDHRHEAIYDEMGNQLEYRKDYSYDGEWDYIEERSFDDEGNMVLYQYKYTDAYDGLGDDWDYRALRTYDEDGNELTWSIDEDADGTFDARWEYTYDEDGNRLTATEDEDDDGLPDTSTAYEYNAAGQMLVAETDSGLDGTIEKRISQTYDVDGNMIERVVEGEPTDPVVYTATCLGAVDEEVVAEFLETHRGSPDDWDIDIEDDEGIDSFSLFEDQMCWWDEHDDGVDHYDEGVDYTVYTGDGWTSAGWTRPMCAEQCLADEDCTGFEYPTDGRYCALYYDWACDMSGLPEIEPPAYSVSSGDDTYTLLP